MKKDGLTAKEKLFWFVGIIALFRLAIGSSFELSMDEAYYWQWGKNLSLSYYDHPPMIAIFLALSTLISDSEIFVRLAAVIGSIAASFLLYRLTIELYGKDIAGFRAVWIANLTLIFSVGALIPTPDTPLLPFYLGGILMFWVAAREKPETEGGYARWGVAGALIGCALLSKYTAFFFYPCALLYLALSTERRGWLAKPHPWFAAVVSFIFFLPVIIWNARNGWASLSFQAGHGLAQSSGNRLAMFGEFLGSQVFFYSVGIFFFLCIAFISLLRPAFGKNRVGDSREAALFLFSFSAPILLFFFFNSFRSRMEGNWPILGFLPLFVQAGVAASDWHLKRWVRRGWFASVFFAIFLFAFLHLQLANPIIPHPQRHEISRRVYGWKLLAEKVNKDRAVNDAAFLIANRHQLTGLMAYYTQPHITAYVLDGNKRRYFFLPETESQKGKNAIYVTEVERDNIERVSKMFERAEKGESLEITRKGEHIRSFVLYRCYNYLGGLN